MSLFVFFISLLIAAQHVSGNHVPIIRSWRLHDVIALCWYVPWLQEGGQVRLVGSASMDGFVSQLALRAKKWHLVGFSYPHRKSIFVLMLLPLFKKWAATAQSVWQLTVGQTIQGLNPGEGKIFCTHTDRAWDPCSLLNTRYWVSLPHVKQPGHGIERPTAI